jgi:acetoacetyl-CoA synthetase
VYAGEISCAALGVDVDVIDASGRPVTDRPGDLVVRQPMPSMPVSFWNDPDGTRMNDAYFTANPGVWTHGDWATRTPRESFIISGRSDATLNRSGVRIGTAELYTVAEQDPAVTDSLAVCLERTDTHG